MKITIETKPLEQVKADALVVLHEEGGVLAQSENEALRHHFDNFSKDVAAKRSKREWFCTLAKDSGVATHHLLLDSVKFGDWAPHDESLKITAARAVDLCRQHSLTKLAFAVHHTVAPTKAAAIVEGVILGDFQDTRFKSSDRERAALELKIVVSPDAAKDVRAAVDRAVAISEAQNMARELLNAPNNVLTPEAMADHAVALAKRHGMKVTVLDEKQLRKQGYLPTWNVGRGSEYPPRIIVIRYTPKKAVLREHLALVGKGMTFDSGGLCIKPGDSMHRMNGDMGGAAAVLGAMEAIGRLRPPVRVTAVIGSAHNAVDGAAYHPGCIITAKNGKTIYVENTDAEGRLVLSDCLYIAGEEKADVIWDFATLTGSVSAALGSAYAGLFTEDEALRMVLLEASQNTGDGLWPLPITREYEPSLKHHLADMNNIAGDRKAGAIHATNFLKSFVPKDTRWAHLDIAGVAQHDKRFRYLRPGGSGYGVRLTMEAIRLLVERES